MSNLYNILEKGFMLHTKQYNSYHDYLVYRFGEITAVEKGIRSILYGR
jgi:hypothetical protein